MGQYSNAISLLQLVAVGVPFWFGLFMFLYRNIGDTNTREEIMYYVANYLAWAFFLACFTSIYAYLEFNNFPRLLLVTVLLIFTGVMFLGFIQNILLGEIAKREKGRWIWRDNLIVFLGCAFLIIAILVVSWFWGNLGT